MIRIDSHQHFWRYTPFEYSWISDAMTVLKRDFLPDDLAPLLHANGIDGSIVVQARQTLEETHWLLELAASHPTVKGVVGWVDLCSPKLDHQLEELVPNRRLVGLRHVLQDEPEDDFMLRPEFQRGISRLAEHGLVYDILIYPRHLPLAARLVRTFPNQQFVLDHLAKPLIAEGQIEPWSRDLRELARCPNVACKLSGMVTEARWNAWRREDFRPYLDVALEAFGPERLMIGSDWPVCTLSGDYGSVMAIGMDYIQPLSASERASILGGACARIYRIGTVSQERFC
jgi:L-fuconolactonase